MTSEDRDMTLFGVPHLARFYFKNDLTKEVYAKTPTPDKRLSAGESAYSTLDGLGDRDYWMYKRCDTPVHVTRWRDE